MEKDTRGSDKITQRYSVRYSEFFGFDESVLHIFTRNARFRSDILMTQKYTKNISFSFIQKKDTRRRRGGGQTRFFFFVYFFCRFLRSIFHFSLRPRNEMETVSNFPSSPRPKRYSVKILGRRTAKRPPKSYKKHHEKSYNFNYSSWKWNRSQIESRSRREDTRKDTLGSFENESRGFSKSLPVVVAGASSSTVFFRNKKTRPT